MKRAYVRRKHSPERLDENRDEINSRSISLFSSNLKKGDSYVRNVCVCVCGRRNVRFESEGHKNL